MLLWWWDLVLILDVTACFSEGFSACSDILCVQCSVGLTTATVNIKCEAVAFDLLCLIGSVFSCLADHHKI